MSRCSLPAACSARTPSTSWKSAGRRRSRSAGDAFMRSASPGTRRARLSRCVGTLGPLFAPRRLLRSWRDRRVVRGSARGRSLDVLQEVGAVDELHREKDAIVVADDELVEPNEVAVMDVRERPELLLEEIESGGARVEEGLERDVLLALTIERLVHDPHAALADAAQDLVPGGPLPVAALRPPDAKEASVVVSAGIASVPPARLRRIAALSARPSHGLAARIGKSEDFTEY